MNLVGLSANGTKPLLASVTLPPVVSGNSTGVFDYGWLGWDGYCATHRRIVHGHRRHALDCPYARVAHRQWRREAVRDASARARMVTAAKSRRGRKGKRR